MGVYIVVCVFILFDVLTGVLKALYNKGINSTALRKGLFHKLSEILTVGGSGLLEYGATYINLGVDLPLVEATSVYICVMELISILENLASVNTHLAKLFGPYLEKLKIKNGDEVKQNGEDSGAKSD